MDVNERWYPPPESGIKPIIVCAAIRCRSIVVCGARHMDKAMRSQIIALSYQWDSSCLVQGFIDQFGNFYDRVEALKIATEAGQINTRRPKTQPLDRLFSEDLY